jgi:hypothetical protein
MAGLTTEYVDACFAQPKAAFSAAHVLGRLLRAKLDNYSVLRQNGCVMADLATAGGRDMFDKNKYAYAAALGELAHALGPRYSLTLSPGGLVTLRAHYVSTEPATTLPTPSAMDADTLRTYIATDRATIAATLRDAAYAAVREGKLVSGHLRVEAPWPPGAAPPTQSELDVWCATLAREALHGLFTPVSSTQTQYRLGPDKLVFILKTAATTETIN